jgi:hypothetical protein
VAEVDYDADREAQIVQSANGEYDKTYNRAKKAYDAAVAAAEQELDKAMSLARDKRDTQYAEAHRGYYEALYTQGEMGEEARALLKRQLDGEVSWNSALGAVNVLEVSDEAKAVEARG